MGLHADDARLTRISRWWQQQQQQHPSAGGREVGEGRMNNPRAPSLSLPSLPLSLSPQSFPFPGKDEFYYGEGLVLNIHNPGFCLRKVTKQGNNATSARIINIHKQNIRHWVVVTIRWHDVLNIHEADIRHWRITTLRQHELINIHELILHVNTKESWYATKKKR